MSAADRLTKTSDIIAVREIDFVSRFSNNWQELMDIFGVTRLVAKVPGTVLKSRYAVVTLQSGAVGEGEAIPYSQASVLNKDYAPIVLNKYKKGVSAEAIADHGYEAAVQLTDDQFLFELQGEVMDKFYDYIEEGELTYGVASGSGAFQAALAAAQGQVRNKWKKMKKGISEVVGFCNILDAYSYLGAANITVQNAFGMNYIEDFLGYSRLFLSSEVDSGKVIATPVENLVLYYINPNDSDFARAGLEFRVDGDTPLIGFHVDGNYSTLVSESTALMGMVLFAEYIDGIAVITIGGSKKSLTFTSVAGTTTTGSTKITVTAPETIPGDWTFYAKAASGTTPSEPDYLATVDNTWTKLNMASGVADNVTGFTSGHKMTLVAVNANGQVVAGGNNVSVVVKG